MDEDIWYEACERCAASPGWDGDYLCPDCEGRCFVPHEHQPETQDAP